MTRYTIPESKVPNIPQKILLGPGPSMVSPRVLKAMVSPMIGYLDADFLDVIDEVSSLLSNVFQTEESLTLALSGTGSAGMEAGFTSLLEPNDTVVMCVYGFFCERMVEMAERVGANVFPVRSEWGKPFPVELLEKELAKHPNVKMVTAVHAETSVGIMQPLEDISRLANEHGALFMVDAVTSLGGSEVAVDRWGIDYCYSASQKCLGCPPGLSPVALSQRAKNEISQRGKKATSWYLDIGLIANYWENHVYHHTTPVTNILGLREGLRIVLEEGLDSRYARHARNGVALRAGLEGLGLDLVSPEGYRLNQITPVWIPEGIDDTSVRETLLRDHNIEIGRGLGEFAGRVWRIGLMGESSKPEYVLALLAALEHILPRAGYETPMGGGVTAASRALSEGVPE